MQGGGAKGALYIGAYKTFKKMLSEMNGRFNSILGTSVGSILGLSFCCGLEPQ